MASGGSGEGMAPSRHAVEEWLERIDEITTAVHEILNEDPADAVQRQKEREAQRSQMEINERRNKIKMRYDPRHYARFENDELIDKLLKEADGVKGGKLRASGDESFYTKAERVALAEALRLKEDAAKAVKASEWTRACELYTSAIVLAAADPALHRTLRNNRALVQLKLKNFLGAADDASYVLGEEPANVKALLRRATALRHLHRPFEALKDAKAALRMEPTSQEAEELARWLRQAKREHGVCAAFQHCNPEEAKRLENAINTLNVAATALREISAERAGNVLEKELGKENCDKTAAVLQAAEAVRQCLDVVKSFQRGAAVLLALHGGVRPLIDILLFLLATGGCSNLFVFESGASSERMSTFGMTFVASARLLALTILWNKTVTEWLEPAVIDDLAKCLADALTSMMREELPAKHETTRVTAIGAAVQLLEAMAAHYPVEVYDRCGSAVIALWGFIRKGRKDPSLLFFYCGLLEVLLGEPSLCSAVVKKLSEEEEVLPCLIETSIAMGLGPLKEAALSLAVRATCVSSAWAKTMGLPEFTRVLADVLLPCQKEGKDLLSPRAEEGLYSVVYNVLLQVDSRPQYVAQWRAATDQSNRGGISFAQHTWHTLCERVASTEGSAARVAVNPKMMGVVAKFFPHDEDLREKMLESEEILWRMIRAALPGQTTVATTGGTRDALKDGEGDDEEGNEEEKDNSLVADSSAWELIEHATTCIASFYSNNLLSREKGLVAEERIAVLLHIVQSSGVNHMVALGNAALIGSFVPPSACKHYATLHGVDVLLEGLRRVRDYLFKLEHDGKKGSAQWIHAGVGQKNLGIALSRCCTVDSQRERMRELKGFETLHAIFERNES